MILRKMIQKKNPWEGKDFANFFAPTFDNEKSSQGYVVMDEQFQNFDHGLGRAYWSFIGDAIYDISNEGIADFEAFGQPH